VKYLAILFVVAACHPRLPPVTHCTPYAQSCINNRPHVCSGDQRQEPSGDLPCSAVGGVCVVTDGRAHCGGSAPSAGASPDAGPTGQ
jgi:hypothetical protein